MCVAFTFIIAFFDAQMAGILSRYLSDFALFTYFGAAVAFLYIFKKQNSEDNKKILIRLLTIGLAFAMLYNSLLIFTHTGESLKSCNADFYYLVKHLVAFWL